MKRMISLLLTLCVLLSLCACGAAGVDPAPVESGAAETPGTPAREAGGEDGSVLARGVYPSMAQRPRQEDYLKENGWEVDGAYFEAEQAWRKDLFALRDQPKGYADGLDPWFRSGIRQFLADAGGENRVVSPLNLTMALAMLSEVTDGETRRQLLDLLGAEDLEALRETAGSLWLQSYQDDGQTASLLASSLWLRQGTSYEQQALDNLAAYYYASAFRGEMGSAAYDALLQSWLNEQTGGLLKEQAAGLHMEPETVLALATTIYFKAPWIGEFSPYLTEDGSFFGPDGEEQVPFLHGSREIPWYWGERFSAVALDMQNGGEMWFLLPEEGLSPEELLLDEELMDFLLLRDKNEWEKQKSPLVRLTIPKFDVSSDLELSAGLRALGLTDAFDPKCSDFTPLTRELEELYVSRVQHAARVKIDEEGCEAAAYTVIEVAAEEACIDEPEPEVIEFILDRPFLFVITNAGGLPLFVGVVNRPVE